MDLVLDTNIALDLLLFDDPACAPLKQALGNGSARWIASAAMRAEFARVLGYPAIAARAQRQGSTAAQLLAAFDAQAVPVPAAAAAPARCQDPDDQVFIDLAVAHRAALLSRDAAVLYMKKELERLAVIAAPAIEKIAKWASDEIESQAAPAHPVTRVSLG